MVLARTGHLSLAGTLAVFSFLAVALTAPASAKESPGAPAKSTQKSERKGEVKPEKKSEGRGEGKSNHDAHQNHPASPS